MLLFTLSPERKLNQVPLYIGNKTMEELLSQEQETDGTVPGTRVAWVGAWELVFSSRVVS